MPGPRLRREPRPGWFGRDDNACPQKKFPRISWRRNFGYIQNFSAADIVAGATIFSTAESAATALVSADAAVPVRVDSRRRRWTAHK